MAGDMDSGKVTGSEEKLFTRKSLTGAGILSLFLIASLVFMGVSWNSGEYDKAYESLEYKVEAREDAELLEGVEYTSQIGQMGSQVTYYAQDGRKLHTEVIKEPVDEIILQGTKSYGKAEEEAKEVINAYCKAWMEQDYGAMIDLAAPDSLQGTTREDLEQAFGISTESLTSYSLGEITIYSLDEWSGRAQDSYGGRGAFSTEPSTQNARIICQAELDLSMASNLYEAVDREGLAYAVFADGQWRVQYFGPLKVIEVGETRDVTRDDYWSGKTFGRLTLGSLILYTDRFALLLGEENTTPRSGEPNASNKDGSLLRDVSVQVSPDTDVNQVYDLCSEVPYDLERGLSHLALFTYQPGLKSGDIVSVEVSDTAFSPLTIP